MRLNNAVFLLAAVISLSACEVSTPTQESTAASAATFNARLHKLALEVQYAEDLSAIKLLQKAYGYYVDKGLWADVAALFAEDAYANYPAGTFKGKASITQHLYRNVGNVPVGQVGLGDKRLYNHLNLQPVVHLGKDGVSARGRWRAMAMFGTFGGAPGTWAEGIYNMGYAKVDGVWKIKTLDYVPDYGDNYTVGWGGNPNPAPAQSRKLAHPADGPAVAPCRGFPDSCVAPFHYGNLGKTADAAVWALPAAVSVEAVANPSAMLGELLQRLQRLQDEQAIENLIRSYGYYYDRAQWDHVADLFSSKATLEFSQQGIFKGKQRIRQFFGSMNNMAGRAPEQQGLVDGWLFDHMQLQTLVTVSTDGVTARARNREWGMTGVVGKSGYWHDGIYENAFVKENGVWKYAAMHYYPTYITDYDKGWTADAQPVPSVDPALPPDAPPSEQYQIFPKAHVPAFHFRNPVTGNEATYPSVGGPSAAVREAALFSPGQPARTTVQNMAAALAQAETLLQLVRDYHEIENLENAYGYYLDKNLWNDLADLFAKGGSMELAQRGKYIGRERVRESLFKLFGSEGPQQGRLGNHIHLQTVIHVSPDGQSGKVRSRMLQQLSFNGRPSMGAAIYENELVREDGKWKFAATHAYNTWSASYAGGWVKTTAARVPGPSADYPPDAAPTLVFPMFPSVYDIPVHYSNPVSGSR